MSSIEPTVHCVRVVSMPFAFTVHSTNTERRIRSGTHGWCPKTQLVRSQTWCFTRRPLFQGVDTASRMRVVAQLCRASNFEAPFEPCPIVLIRPFLVIVRMTYIGLALSVGGYGREGIDLLYERDGGRFAERRQEGMFAWTGRCRSGARSR